ncbi:rho GTPase-activating protein 5-like isoform X12 [Branchiostoma floridae x Branchiostoma japonicum]
MAKTKEMRTFNISVVGLSGTERDKGAQGVGKSCLCNRFVRPLADNYFHEHISVLSQSDFGGRVVNNDHFLYWGEVTKTWDEGQDFTFHVVEQTEFIDDTSFQTLRTSTFMPYIKRAAVAKVVSAEKLMYICKDQLGIEQDFEQKTMPEGKLNIDGFILVCDVSLVQNRPQEDQMRFLQNCFTTLAKTKKPALLVATKCDDAVDQYLREARDFASNRRVGIPLVETSAHENVNVDLAFVVLAQMIDKSRGKSKIIPFHEAAVRRKEVLDVATEAYQNLVVRTVRDYHDTWNSVSKKLEREPDFQHYCDLLGKMSAKKLFRRHIKKLKEEHQARRQVEYLSQLPRALDALAPSLDLILDRTWPSVQNILQRQDQFEEWFVVLPEDMPWRESDHVDSMVDKRIPFDLLEMPEAETVFKNHVNKLQAAQKKERMKHEFRRLLEHTGHVLPGKPWEDVHIFLMEEESYQELTEGEKIDIYSYHQRELIERAREDFQELLFEKADLFARLDPHEQISHQDLVDIKEALQEESRYQALARLDNERDVLLLKHIGFITCPSKETCLSGPNCMETLLQNAVDTAVHRPTSWNRHSQWMFDPNASQLNIVILGADGLADELANEIKLQCNEEEYTLDGNIYSLELRPIDGDVTQPMSSFKTPKFTPNATCRRHPSLTVCHDCCICVYDSVESLKYAQSSLEQTVIRSGTLSIDKKERAPFQGLPCAVILARNSANTDKDLSYLREEGQHLAERLQCPFIDISSTEFFPNRKFQEAQIQQAMRALVESFRHREGWIGSQSIEQLMEPDIKVKLSTVCGDPYNVELPLAPLLNHQCCTAAPEKPSTLIVETFLGSCKRRVELRLTSFHSAQKYRDELVHGYILVYSAKRKASLANVRAFASNLKNVPVHILAVTESGSVNAFFTNDVEQVLITEGNALADQLTAKFSTTSSQFQKQTAVFTPFFKECWEKKESTETAYKRQPSSEDEPTEREVWESTFGRVRPPATLPKPSRVPLPRYSYDEAPQNYNSDEEPPPYNGEGYHDNHHEEHLLKPSQVRDRQQQGRAGRFAPDSAYQSDGDDEERKKRNKELEKLERQQRKDTKRKQKEEEKLKKKMEKQKSKTKPFPLPQQKNLSGNYFGLPMEKIVQSEDNPIPLFVEMCVKYIENEGIRTEGIFRVNGKKEDTDLIRLKFDEEEITDLNDLQVADGDHKVSVNAAAGALKSFFVELPEPLIPHSVHDDLIVAISTKDDQIKTRNLREVLRKLSPVTQAVFKYLLEHLYRVSEFSSDNKMTSENLAICFMPTLMRPDFSTFDMGAQSQKILLMDNFIRLTPQIYEDAGS